MYWKSGFMDGFVQIHGNRRKKDRKIKNKINRKRRLQEIEIKEAIYKMYNAIKLLSINKEEEIGRAHV